MLAAEISTPTTHTLLVMLSFVLSRLGQQGKNVLLTPPVKRLNYSPFCHIVRFVAGLGVALVLLLGSVDKAAGQCAVNKVTTTVSGCYSVSGVSKATVSVEVDWSNAPASDYIVVTSGAQSRTITPGTVTVVYAQLVGTRTGTTTIVSPQVVAFEVNADNSVGSVSATFHNTPACTKTSSFTAPASCLPTACSGTGLGGMLFKDFNDNGIHEAGETVGVSQATVQAVACDGTVYTTTTDAYGRYTLAVPANKYPVRVEFSNIPSIYNLSVNGADSRTTTQFVDAPDCNADLGVNNPVDYCSNTPQIFVPCYSYGDPLISGSSSATSAALVTIPYGVSSVTQFTGEKMLATAGQVGTVWGMAYNKATKKLFQSAVLKRHAGLGPAGLGGLYVTDYTNPNSATTSTFLSVTAIGIDVGTIPGNPARGLVGNKTQPSHDPESFSLTAKAGIGDLEISEDGNKLWLMNLNDKKLYSINIAPYNLDGVTKPVAADVASFTIPASCTNGSFRPWALKVYNGKVYVGGVCDAQATGNKSNLRASVYELNGSTFTSIFDFPLTYPKGYPAAGNTNITGWFPWTDNFDQLLDGTALRHPVPIFTDIEFDIDGSMVLAFGDRTGFQGGDRNYRPDGSSTTLYETNSQAGDILRAFYANGTFVLENNAKAGPSVGFGAGNSQGPGFGEFYNDNWVQDGGTNVFYHAENVMGGLALKPGTGEVVVTTIDPVDAHPYAGGVRYMNNKTGVSTNQYAVYITRGPDGTPNPDTFAKATGLGDIELSCNTLTLLEIGSRVWLDTDRDGEQDACEKGLAGTTVSLFKAGVLIASTTSDTNGDYFFSSKSKLTTGTWSGTGADTTVRANQAYQLAFGTGQYTGNILNLNPGRYLLTVANATGGTKNNDNDSDAQEAVIGGVTTPVISLTTAGVGSVNHTFDAGFYCQETSVASISTTKTTCPGTTTVANADARIDLTGIVNADKVFLYTTSPPAYSAAGGQSVLTGAVSFTGLSNPVSASGTSYSAIVYSGACCYTTVSVTLAQQLCTVCSLSATAAATACSPLTNRYSVSGTVTITNGPASQTLTVSTGGASTIATLTDSGVLSYTLSGLPSDGLTHTVSVVSSATGCAATSANYTAPASCSVAPALSATLVAGACDALTNQYTVSGTLSFTAPAVTIFTLTDGSSTLPVSVTAGKGTAPFTLTGLTSGTGSHTLIITSPTYPTVTAVYAAPVSCTVAPPCSLMVNAIPDACDPATNRHNLTGTLTIVNGPASQTLTISNGSVSTTKVVTGDGAVSYTLSGLLSDGLNHTVSVTSSATACAVASASYAAPASCSITPELSILITSTTCSTATGQYTVTGTISFTAAVDALLTVADGANSTSVVVTSGQTNTSFNLGGLLSGSGAHTLTVSGTGYASKSVSYTAPASCLIVNPAYVLTKTVDKKLAAPGDVLTYILTVTNTSTVTAQNVVVTDQFTAGLTYASASPASGTFTPAPGSPAGGTWSIPMLAGGATTSLTLTASVTTVGIVYNTAILGADTVTACTSIPFHVCAGTDYLYRLTAKPGRSAYQWYKGTVAIPGATTNVLDVTAPGEYSLAVNGAAGQCADFTCCPFIVIEDALPDSYSVAAIPATCAGPVAASNGQLTVSLPTGTTAAAGLTYQYSVALGGAFNLATAQTVSAPSVTASGVLVNNLPAVSAPVTYVVRVTNAAGCFRDAVITLAPTVCVCKPVICAPLVIRKTSLGAGQ